jgi:hydroxyacylglutathione hydrolase
MEELTVLTTGPLGVNSYIIPLTENDVLVIDPAACAFTGDETKITGWLSEHQKHPAGVIITHGHFDHITGLPAFRSFFPSCAIAIHKIDANSLGPHSFDSQHDALRIMGLEQFGSALQNIPSADFLLSGNETLDTVFAGNKQENTLNALAQWKVIHTPGHSPGSICLYNKMRGELISGDTLFYHSYGRTDLGGSEQNIIHSLINLRKTLPPDTKVYPGHDRYGFTLEEGF